MNTPRGVQRCDACAPDWFGDLDAALLLADLVGGYAYFWQHDADRVHDRDNEDGDDLAEAGFIARRFQHPRRVDDQILTGTDPWVEIDAHAVDWFSYGLGHRHARRPA